MSSTILKIFTFNDFYENTYLLYNEQHEGIIIDPGCYSRQEQQTLADFISENNITPKRLLLTHSHIDHILGADFICKTYGLTPENHSADVETFLRVKTYAHVYGFDGYAEATEPSGKLNLGDKFTFGNAEFEIRYVPGHAPGHVVFINHTDKYVINGDCLFAGSIGRTDLPGGNHEQLLNAIREQLFTLPENYTVYCGHGPETTIGKEKMSNPFLT
jgi:hydroxyacylglutathione hydrolase